MRVYIPVDLQRQLRDGFANCCAYCRTAEDLTVAIFEFEHITPRSAGGETVFENLCLACPTCNRFKEKKPSVARRLGPVVRGAFSFYLFIIVHLSLVICHLPEAAVSPLGGFD